MTLTLLKMVAKDFQPKFMLIMEIQKRSLILNMAVSIFCWNFNYPHILSEN